MLKVAVIGVGSMGSNHARVYRELPETDLVAVVDANYDQAQHVADKYTTASYQDHHKMLSEVRPDAVSIAVPTAEHVPVSLDVLEAGAHILIEKPISATMEGGQEIINRAKQTNRKLMIGHIVRFNPAIQALKARLIAGDLGRIYQIVCRRIGPFPDRIRDVGVVIDLAPHDLDLMRYLTGLNPVRVYAETGQRIHTEHEDLLFGLLRFPGDVTGAIEINWLTPSKIREVLVLGERGLYRVDDLTQDLYFYENIRANGTLWPTLQNLKGVSEGSMTRYHIKRYEPLKAELKAFIKAIKGEISIPVTGEDGLEAVRLALALVESGQNNQVIEV